jgi:predicted dehydrogenase/threonine dehydrogenase-like Zn-dependent dehydrogenase
VKQVLQDVRSGEIAVHEVPEPSAAPGMVLVAVRHSVISAGTERAMAGLGAKSLLQKARARPDLVRKTIDAARTEGVGQTIAKVRGRLDEYTAFGYSCAGIVLDTGGDPRLAVGMAVACVGQGYASHAEVVSVPSALVVPLPEGVATAAAAFAAPSAIALHAIRLTGVQAGSTVAVVGLGLVGQLAGRLLRASGIKTVGTDPRADRRSLFGESADSSGFAAAVAAPSRGRGADAVLVCAATASNEPVELAAEVARDRAAIVVVGDVGLELDRRIFYEKELSFVVARSYGPGRYDRDYEERGLDYPVGQVRWTESRNVEAVLDLLAAGLLHVDDLVTHRMPVGDGARAYETLDGDASAIGVLLEYTAPEERRRTIRMRSLEPRTGALRVGLIGAGAFARGTLLPVLLSFDDVKLAAVCTRSGASAKSIADRHGVPLVSTDWDEIVASSDVDALVVATPHAHHAAIAAAGLRAGKAVFVEKPLAIDREGLADVADAAAAGGVLLAGHNRRFAPLAQLLRERISGRVIVQIRVAAGRLAAGHWLEDPEHGGRVLGEISHFVDLASFLAGATPNEVSAETVGGGLLGLLRFSNGSAASIAYSVGESGRLPKERVEVLGASASAVLDDFERLEIFGAGATTEKGKRDKGHRGQLRAFVDAALGRAPLPVPVDELLEVAAASLALVEAAASGKAVDVNSVTSGR